MSTGKFKAKLVDVGVVTISSGSTKIVMKCECVDGDKKFIRTGEFFLTDKAKQRTLMTLATVGYQFQDDDMCDVDDLNAYDRTVEFMATVELEEYTKDGQQKSTEKITFINPIGSGEIRNALAKDEVVVKMKGLSLGGDVMAMREKLGIKKGQAKTTQTQTDFKSDIPF